MVALGRKIMFLSTFISLGWCLSWQGLRKHMTEIMHYLPGWGWGKAPALQSVDPRPAIPTRQDLCCVWWELGWRIVKANRIVLPACRAAGMGLRGTGSALPLLSSGHFCHYLFLKTGPELPPSHHNHQPIP